MTTEINKICKNGLLLFRAAAVSNLEQGVLEEHVGAALSDSWEESYINATGRAHMFAPRGLMFRCQLWRYYQEASVWKRSEKGKKHW